MSDLRFVGTPSDFDRLTLLAKRLETVGFIISIELAGSRQADPAYTPDPTDRPYANTGVIPVLIVCWTLAAIGPAGEALRARALELKTHNDYLGLLLDDVTPPEEVRAAQDISLVGWEAADKQLQPLIDALKSREAEPSSRSVLAALARSIRSLIVRIEHLHFRLKAFGVVAIVTLIFSAFSWYFAWLDKQDAICSWPAAKGLCRNFGFGHLPSIKAERQWRVIAAGSSCEAFEGYLKDNGPSAPFSAEARHRVSLPRYDPLPQHLALQLSVGWAERSSSTEAEARREVEIRASAEAQRICTDNAQAFAVQTTPGTKVEAAPGTFIGDGKPDCVSNGAGHICSWKGHARCSFLIPGELKTCPGKQ